MQAEEFKDNIFVEKASFLRGFFIVSLTGRFRKDIIEQMFGK